VVRKHIRVNAAEVYFRQERPRKSKQCPPSVTFGFLVFGWKRITLFRLGREQSAKQMGAFLVRISKCKLGSTGAANMASSGPSGDAFTRFNRLPCLRKGRDFLQYTGKNVRSFSRIVHTLHALIGAFSRRERTVGGRLTSPSRVAKARREPSKFNYRLRPNSKLHQF
jgi:hypothetical protein